MITAFYFVVPLVAEALAGADEVLLLDEELDDEDESEVEAEGLLLVEAAVSPDPPDFAPPFDDE